jgi:hypothetical protein
MASQPDAAQVDAVAPEAQPVDTNQPTAPLYPDDQPANEDTQGAEPETPDEETTDPLVDAAADAEQPPIDAPASWAKDAKEVFATLPREAQEIVAAREVERDREVRRAQNNAAVARQTAEREAIGQVRGIHDQLFQQYQQLAQTIQVQEPDIRLLQSADPQHHALYHEQDRQYRVASAQYQQIAQAAQMAKQRSDQIAEHEEQQELAARYQSLVEAFPEWADPAGQANLIAQLEPIATELGYPRELLPNADVHDFKALQQALSWKRDSDELRTLKNKAKMVPVRAAKQAPPVAPVRAPTATQAAKPVGSLAQLYPDDMPK